MGGGHSRGQALGDQYGIHRRSCAWFAERAMYHVEDQDVRNLKIQVTLKQRSGPLDPAQKRASISAPANNSAQSGMPAADPAQPSPTSGMPPAASATHDPNNPHAQPPHAADPAAPTLINSLAPADFVNTTGEFVWQSRVIGNHEIYLLKEHPSSGRGDLGVAPQVAQEIRQGNPAGNILYTYNDRDNYEDGKTGLRFTQGGSVHDPPDALADVHRSDGPFFRMAPYILILNLL